MSHYLWWVTVMSHFYESPVLVILMSHNFFLLEIFNFFFSDSSHSSRVAPITKYSILIGRDKRRRERRIRCVGVSRKDSSERRLIFLYYVTFKREIQKNKKKREIELMKKKSNRYVIMTHNDVMINDVITSPTWLISYDHTVVIIRFMILIARRLINGPDITLPL